MRVMHVHRLRGSRRLRAAPADAPARAAEPRDRRPLRRARRRGARAASTSSSTCSACRTTASVRHATSIRRSPIVSQRAIARLSTRPRPHAPRPRRRLRRRVAADARRCISHEAQRRPVPARAFPARRAARAHAARRRDHLHHRSACALQRRARRACPRRRSPSCTTGSTTSRPPGARRDGPTLPDDAPRAPRDLDGSSSRRASTSRSRRWRAIRVPASRSGARRPRCRQRSGGARRGSPRPGASPTPSSSPASVGRRRRLASSAPTSSSTRPAGRDSASCSSKRCSRELPVVASAVSSIPEIVVDGSTGLLVPPDDAGGSGRRRHALLDDPARARAYGEAGLERAQTAFSVAAMAERTGADLRAIGLAGGLYGVGVGGLFAAESKFHRRTGASKAALLALILHLQSLGGARLLDVQWMTPHLRSLGVVEITARSITRGSITRSRCRTRSRGAAEKTSERRKARKPRTRLKPVIGPGRARAAER